MKEPKYAMIYPFIRDHIQRIFEGRDVICKYTGRGTPNITTGSKILFYASGGEFELLGDADIRTMQFVTPSEIVPKYRRRLFISQEELEKYRGSRSPERTLLVLELSGVRKFPKAIKMEKYVTMAGQTLDREQYRKVLSSLKP